MEPNQSSGPNRAPSSEPSIDLSSKALRLSDKLKDHIVLIVLGTAVSSFAAGWGAYKAVLEAQGQELILKERRLAFERTEADLKNCQTLLAAQPPLVNAEPTSFDYLDWRGKPAHATISNDGFLVSYEDSKDKPARFMETLRYKTWDASNWEAVLRHSTFLHAPNGDLTNKDARRAEVLNYLSPSNAQLSVKLAPSGVKRHGS